MVLTSSDDNALQRNIVTNTNGDGILVERGSTTTALIDNVVIASSDDGIEIEARSTALARNQANRNVALGIDAVPGVIDGGGNSAHGNGDPRQCVNVSCR